jgi:hypothetical protein
MKPQIFLLLAMPLHLDGRQAATKHLAVIPARQQHNARSGIICRTYQATRIALYQSFNTLLRQCFSTLSATVHMNLQYCYCKHRASTFSLPS